MFRKFPYWGWLILAILGWACLAGWAYYEKQQLRPEALAGQVSEDIEARESALQALLSRKEMFERMFKDSLSAHELSLLSEQPFHIYAFDRDTLVYWNNNTTVTVCEAVVQQGTETSLFEHNGVYLKKCLPLNQGRSLVILYPIVYRFPLENEYLQSQFAASRFIPTGTAVTAMPLVGSLPVRNKKGDTLFFLTIETSSIPSWMPGTVMLMCMLLVLIVTISWVNLVAVRSARSGKGVQGLLFILVCLLLFRGITFFTGLPFNLSELLLFSPKLYASSALLPSLGHLIIDLLSVLWLMIFFLAFVPLGGLHAWFSGRLRWVAIVGLSFVLAASSFGAADIIANLIINSRISFDVSNFYTISARTVAGLFTTALIACCTGLFIYIVYGQLRLLLHKKWQRYLSVAGVCLLVLVAERFEAPPYELWAVYGLLIMIALLDVTAYHGRSQLFAPRMIYLAAFIALFATLAVNYFTLRKEREERRSFASKAIKQRDRVMEFVFTDVAAQITKDQMLQAYLDTPLLDTRPLIDRHLSTVYLQGPLNKYLPQIYLFDAEGQELFNPDTSQLAALRSIAATGKSVGDHLFYLEAASDAHYYMAVIPVEKDTGELKGYVVLDMNLKRSLNASVYPELLEPGQQDELTPGREFSYAVYQDRKLVSQTYDYPFPVYIADTIDADGFRKITSDDYIIRYYQVNPETIVTIVEPYNPVLRLVTLGSYLLGMLILFAILTFIFRVYFYYLLRRPEAEPLFHLTLRRRIHLSMLGVVLISFSVIGAVTIWFFVARYEQTNRARIQSGMQVVERSLQQYLKNEGVRQDPFFFRQETERPNFKYWVSNLASSQSIDINIYDTYGSLTSTSQEAIYNKSILARIMEPTAYYALAAQNSPRLIQEEQIGQLDYLSGYTPVRSETGQTIGYINIPFFASERELNYQISNILVALINLYALIFLLSSVLAVFITDWLTRALHVIIGRFEQFSLHGKNELLEWPYDDEIGVLVREYNKLVRKLEENAALLAQTERESAWREMAQQVAHEIKNPLTPMKLNIQYLQQALRNNHPQLRELTANVSESLIEQIDNLTHIASAFSDFAKMPEARSEMIELNELLHKAVELYLNEQQVKVVFMGTDEAMHVSADKSQLLRVFTNLLKNAIEAIPEERQGLVQVSLWREEGSAMISFKDNGTGIPEEVLERIFSPYFTTKGSGTGLGLAMTKKIIEFWKGKIWFETVAGSGTTFFIRLPLLQRGV